MRSEYSSKRNIFLSEIRWMIGCLAVSLFAMLRALWLWVFDLPTTTPFTTGVWFSFRVPLPGGTPEPGWFSW